MAALLEGSSSLGFVETKLRRRSEKSNRRVKIIIREFANFQTSVYFSGNFRAVIDGKRGLNPTRLKGDKIIREVTKQQKNGFVL